MNKITVKVVEVDELIPAPPEENARKHGPLEPLMRSIERHGQRTPIVVDANGVVRKGNRTLKALIALGWTKVNITPYEEEGWKAIEYAITDNRTAEDSTWDNAFLGPRLVKYAEEVGDPTEVGFTAAELERIFAAQVAAMEPDLPAAPGPAPAAGDGTLAAGTAPTPPVAPPSTSHVRMYQLFLTVETHPVFSARVRGLMEKWGEASPTDAIFAAIEKCAVEAGVEE